MDFKKTALGLEFGSTRIKAVLIDEHNKPIASGSHEWENQLVNNIWTYDMDDVWKGIQDCYAKLAGDVQKQYGVPLGSSSFAPASVSCPAQSPAFITAGSISFSFQGKALSAISESKEASIASS